MTETLEIPLIESVNDDQVGSLTYRSTSWSWVYVPGASADSCEGETRIYAPTKSEAAAELERSLILALAMVRAHRRKFAAGGAP